MRYTSGAACQTLLELYTFFSFSLHSIIFTVLYLICSAFAQTSVPHEIHCRFVLERGFYSCNIDDVNVITETVPLTFFNVHLPDLSDIDVTAIDTESNRKLNKTNDTNEYHQMKEFFLGPNNVSLLVIHPQLLQQFPNLRSVHFSQSQVESLVANSFESCGEVTALYLDRNRLTSVPPRSFQHCTKLRVLDLSGNSELVVNAESFYGLQSLDSLRIEIGIVSNGIFANLPQLRELYLTGVRELGSEALRHMEKLEMIQISGSTSLAQSEIQDAIRGMTSVTGIWLSHNGFTTFDFTFFEQLQLEEFGLHGNLLTTIPDNSFANYRSLEALRLHSNRISVLTNESFAGLQNLDVLTLYDNRLIHLSPNTFHQLINLRTLHLSNNNLPQIDPGTFNGLQNLDTLFLNSVPLSNLIPGMFESLENLRTLEIIDSQIAEIPADIFTPLKNLLNLNLGFNRIIRLNSNSFGSLPLLNSFLLSNDRDEGVNAIERNLFSNLPSLSRFGGSGHVCFNGVVDVSLVNFGGRTVFDNCFSNWEGVSSTTELTTTPSNNNGAIVDTITFWRLVMFIGIRGLYDYL